MAITIKDIAKRAGVAPSTVSVALTPRNSAIGVSQKTRLKVLKAARELKYTPNVIARGLKTGKSYTVGVLATKIAYSFLPIILQGIEDSLDENGFTMMLCNYDSPEQFLSKIELLKEKKVDGYIVVPNTLPEYHNAYKKVAYGNLPLIFIAAEISGVEVPSVLVSGEKIGYLATNCFISKGHTRIAFCKSSRGDRIKGYQKALNEAGIPFDPNIIFYSDKDYFEYGKYILNKLIEEYPNVTAIYAYSDKFAAGILFAAAERGIMIPEQLSIIAVGDNELSQVLYPPLTVVEQPKYEQGTLGAELLLKILSGKKDISIGSVILNPHLIERKSVKDITNFAQYPKLGDHKICPDIQK